MSFRKSQIWHSEILFFQPILSCICWLSDAVSHYLPICAFCMCSEFKLIHELCLYVLSASQRQDLIRATLSALHAYLSWIPLGYIFESPLVIYLKLGIDLKWYHNYVLLIAVLVVYSLRPSLNSFLCQHIGTSLFNV